jgi:two-component system phosphate regulon sensor histidine kinase PhoR
MHRRIPLLFSLLIAATIGINTLQAYWVYTAYQEANTQFEQVVNEALVKATYQQRWPADRALLPAIKQSLQKGTPLPLQPVTEPLSKTLREISALYRQELRRHAIEADFVLDTVNTRLPTRGYGPRVDAPASLSLHTKPVELYHYPVYNSPWHVVAAFHPPAFYLLRRLGGMLGASLLLLALTGSCFGLMRRVIRQQQQLAALKNDFIHNITHELTTPLATASAAVEALQHFGALEDPQRAQAYLALARTDLQRLADLLSQVLQLAVEGRQALALQPEWVEPAALLRALVTRYEVASPKPVHFEVDIVPGPALRLDVLHLTGVLTNLVDNALKYSYEQVHITLRSRQDATGWSLTVQDDGIGIDSDYQDAIFEQFFRVPTGNLHPVKGFGLGLYYVRQIIEHHGGWVHVQSEPARGTTFSLWLPA